jgi:hypothetical protein
MERKMSGVSKNPSPLRGEGGAQPKAGRVRARRSVGSASAVTLTQLRPGSFVAKAPYPSPLKGEGRFV